MLEAIALVACLSNEPKCSTLTKYQTIESCQTVLDKINEMGTIPWARLHCAGSAMPEPTPVPQPPPQMPVYRPTLLPYATGGKSQLYITLGSVRGTSAVLVFPTRDACKNAAQEQVDRHISSAGQDGRATCVGDDGSTFYEVRCDWFGRTEKWTDNAAVTFTSEDKIWKQTCGHREG